MNASSRTSLLSSLPATAERSGDLGRSGVLALDLGTTTGWAMQSVGSTIESGTVSFRPSRYDGGGMRYCDFAAGWTSMSTNAAGIGVVYFEEVRGTPARTRRIIYGGLLATLTAWCEQRSIAYQGVPVGTIKRFITGKGNADKQPVMNAVRARGFSPADDNEADAIAILLWAIETHGGVR